MSNSALQEKFLQPEDVECDLCDFGTESEKNEERRDREKDEKDRERSERADSRCAKEADAKAKALQETKHENQTRKDHNQKHAATFREDRPDRGEPGANANGANVSALTDSIDAIDNPIGLLHPDIPFIPCHSRIFQNHKLMISNYIYCLARCHKHKGLPGGLPGKISLEAF